MANSTRSAKLADRIKVVVAETLKTRIKDPRLGFVTITDTRITGDLREATVFYTVFGDEEERAATAAALESAKGILRSEVGRQTGVKFTPSLAFILDAIPQGAKQIDDLLAKAAAEDARVREIAQGKDFAGEADPYKAPRDLDDDEDEDDEVASGQSAATGAVRTEAAGQAGDAEAIEDAEETDDEDER
jgi:ribosome-binding factor A